MIKRRTTIWVLLAAGVLALPGCDETAKKEVHVQPPAATPKPAPAEVSEPLPLIEAGYPAWFAHDPRPAMDILVDRVQAGFDAGEKDYQAGHLDKARADFDGAVNLILTSGFQGDSDPRLSKLFDQIGDAVASYGLDADQGSGDEESETPSEPAPIEEIADLTLPAGDPRLALKAESELIGVPHDLPLAVNDSVLQYLSFFTTERGRAIVGRGLERAGRYSDMIRRVLKEEGVPQDLIYLAQAESAFLPDSVSRAGARGIWQFMPYRGEEYDLERSYWVDQRSDPEMATRAAARHLRDLYEMFGDWYLVMAAYNSGPLTVARAIERTGYADFWELQRLHALPKQTQNYVPIIIALALVAKDPALYGVQFDADKPPQVETVRLEHPVSLSLAADATGADLDDLRLLNPELLRGVTPDQPGFELNLPAGTARNFEENIQQVPEDKWTTWRLHTVVEGETLPDIAERYRVTLPALESANHLEAHASVPAGFVLDVPAAPPVIRLVHYRVQRDDTLEGIADRFDVTVAELKRWNRIAGHHMARGMRLRIYAGSGDTAATSRAPSKPVRSSGSAVRNVSTHASEKSDALEHRVKPGETLYSIAREYGTTVSALRESNPFLSGRPLEPGDVLTVQR
ncbi:MAG: LysM peptidoglycan-binding domain-containing protein [Candidatus Acidiferrales bacterium]